MLTYLLFSILILTLVARVYGLRHPRTTYRAHSLSGKLKSIPQEIRISSGLTQVVVSRYGAVEIPSKCVPRNRHERRALDAQVRKQRGESEMNLLLVFVGIVAFGLTLTAYRKMQDNDLERACADAGGEFVRLEGYPVCFAAGITIEVDP